MPTAARMTAAICLAALAYVLSQMIMPLMPDSTDFGYFVPTNIAVGLLAGWTVMGPRVRPGLWSGISNGLTGTTVLVLWGLATQSIIEMLDLSMSRRYDGMFEALIDALRIGAELFLIMATVPIGITVLVGGVLSGLVTQFIGARWP